VWLGKAVFPPTWERQEDHKFKAGLSKISQALSQNQKDWRHGSSDTVLV
jgi:hypothetical protein